jgi:hypothetical protein
MHAKRRMYETFGNYIWSGRSQVLAQIHILRRTTMAELMAFSTAKMVLKSYTCWQLRRLGFPYTDIAKEEGISVAEVKKRINRIEYYIRNHMLEWQLEEAKRRIVAGTMRKVDPVEELPVRCASGCRFSPLR